MKRSLIICSIIFSFFLTDLPGQTKEEQLEFFQERNFFFNRADYEEALYFSKRLWQTDSLNANFNFLLGECYLNIPGKEFLAAPYFEKASLQLVPKKRYKSSSIKESKAPLHALFYLGNAYRAGNMLDKALDSYSKFLDSPYFWGNYNQDVVESEIRSCERAIIIQDAPVEFELSNLGRSINTKFAEERPVISGDGKSLIFIRRLKFYDAVFYSLLKDGEWSEAVNIDPQILSDGDFYPADLSFDGTRLLLVKKGPEVSDIYFSTLVEGQWTKAEKFDNTINSIYLETHASFGQDEKVLYISSNRPSGRGGFDIYESEMHPNGEWGKLRNLGKTINTSNDDQVAFFSAGRNILFFHSKEHYNMGGYDIFYSSLREGEWTTPINIGFPINDTRDNLYYCPLENERMGLYALDRVEGYGNTDIYLITITSPSTLNFDSLAKDE